MLWHLYKKELMESIAILIVFIIVYVILRAFGITCIVYKIFHMPCPTCYMTRALCALMKADFKLYTRYNVMAFPVAVVFIGELFNWAYSKHKIIFHCFTAVILVLNLLYYIFRIKNNLI